MLEPTISSVDQYSHKMGQKAAKLLFETISDKNQNIEFQNIVLSTNLLIRGSSKKVL
jgi:DNA-binding LacI/PurR family transcriptional regulator